MQACQFIFSVKLRFAGGRELDVSRYLCPADNSRYSVIERDAELKFSLTAEPTGGCGCSDEPTHAASGESSFEEFSDEESEEEDPAEVSRNDSGVFDDETDLTVLAGGHSGMPPLIPRWYPGGGGGGGSGGGGGGGDGGGGAPPNGPPAPVPVPPAGNGPPAPARRRAHPDRFTRDSLRRRTRRLRLAHQLNRFKMSNRTIR